jgi:DsbC/DsbD-like thiol-disulfide interchange protein
LSFGPDDLSLGGDEVIMSAARSAVCAFFVAVLAVAPGAYGQVSAPGTLASPWVELHNARARLVAGAPAAKAGKSYLAGVEITLGDGWKTYWRMPGDAGVPPSFDWSGSTNVAGATVLYPSPVRMSEPAAETVGYKHSVLFPVEVVPKDPSKPVALTLSMEFGVCREICIPAEAKFSLTLPPGAMAGTPSTELLAALDKVPRPKASRHIDDPQVTRSMAFLEGGAPHLVVVARFPRGDSGADLFIEAPDGLYVPMAKRMPEAVAGGEPRLEADSASGLVRFEVDLSRTGNAAELRGKSLRLTLVSDAGASETDWTLP